MHTHQTVYKDGSVDWDPELYDDTIRLSNRCQTFSELIRQSPDMWKHFSYNQAAVAGAVLFSESVPGHTYVEGFAPQSDDENLKGLYYCSCRIYPPPYLIQSATAVMSGNEERIRLTFVGRFHNDPDHFYPTNPDASTWPEASVQFDKRTDENGIIAYLYSKATGNKLVHIIGDSAINRGNNISGFGNPFGVLPRFHLTKLIPEVSEDTDDVSDPADAICDADQFTQIATYLRAMCEGWVDRVASIQYSCVENSHVVDFTFANLMLAASNNLYSEYPLMPLAIRGDSYNVRGAGPLSNTTLFALHYNLLANALNAMTRLRLEIPVQSRFRILRYETRIPIEPTGSNGALDCNSYGGRWFDAAAIPGASTLIDTDEWTPWEDGFLRAGYSVAHDAGVVVASSGSGCELVATRDDVEVEVRVPPGVDCAVPPALKASLGTVEVFGFRTTTLSASHHRVTVPLESSVICDTAATNNYRPFHDAGGYYDWTIDIPPATSQCQSILDGDTPPGLVASSDLYQGKHPAGGGAPEGYCNNGPISRVAFEATKTSIPVIVFALDDPSP
jgi:hypothetical protein